MAVEVAILGVHTKVLDGSRTLVEKQSDVDIAVGGVEDGEFK